MPRARKRPFPGRRARRRDRREVAAVLRGGRRPHQDQRRQRRQPEHPADAGGGHAGRPSARPRIRLGEAKAAEDEAAAEAERIRREDEDPLAASELKRELALVRRRPGGQALGGPGARLGLRLAARVGPGVPAQPADRLRAAGRRPGARPARDRVPGHRSPLALHPGPFAVRPGRGLGRPAARQPAPERDRRPAARHPQLRARGRCTPSPAPAWAVRPDGGFRLVVPASREAELPRSDTVRGGPFLVGAAAGLVYHFSRRVAWPLEARVLAGLPSLAAVWSSAPAWRSPSEAGRLRAPVRCRSGRRRPGPACRRGRAGGRARGWSGRPGRAG